MDGALDKAIAYTIMIFSQSLMNYRMTVGQCLATGRILFIFGSMVYVHHP
jgi:hypothetical protein